MKQRSSERLSILHKVTQLICCQNAEQESQVQSKVSHPCIWNPILLCSNLVPLTDDNFCDNIAPATIIKPKSIAHFVVNVALSTRCIVFHLIPIWASYEVDMTIDSRSSDQGSHDGHCLLKNTVLKDKSSINFPLWKMGPWLLQATAHLFQVLSIVLVLPQSPWHPPLP